MEKRERMLDRLGRMEITYRYGYQEEECLYHIALPRSIFYGYVFSSLPVKGFALKPEGRNPTMGFSPSPQTAISTGL